MTHSPSSFDGNRRQDDRRTFDAVVLGGSAGGVEVLNRLLAALPEGFSAAVLVVTHLPADAPSYLLQTFGYCTALPVIEPDAGERVVAGRIHVAPPGYHMLVADDRTIALSIGASVRFFAAVDRRAVRIGRARLRGAPARHSAVGRQRRRRTRSRSDPRDGRRRVGASAGNGNVRIDAARRDRSGSGR